MYNKLFIATLIISLFTLSCSNECKNSEEQNYFYKTLSNNSTSPDFIVITAVDKKTKISKEICFESSNNYFWIYI